MTGKVWTLRGISWVFCWFCLGFFVLWFGFFSGEFNFVILISYTILWISIGWYLCWHNVPIIHVTIIEPNIKSLCYAKFGPGERCELLNRLSLLPLPCALVGLDEWSVFGTFQVEDGEELEAVYREHVCGSNCLDTCMTLKSLVWCSRAEADICKSLRH